MLLPHQLTATVAAAAIRAKTLTSYALVQSCLTHIAGREPLVRAWAYLDAEGALEAARQSDREAPRSALHGIPIGIKDVIATAGMPTCHNSPIYAGSTGGVDADVVTLATNAGMIILGKTTTQEFATRGNVAPTRNPSDHTRSPGGSSSGSAAAVADLMVPLALSTQTAGSIIRPASYCGVVGFKPSVGAISPRGVKSVVPSFDTVGVHTRSLDDAAAAFRILRPVNTDGETDDPCEDGDMPGRLKVALVAGPHRSSIESASALAWQHAKALLAQSTSDIEATEIALDEFLEKLTHAHDIISDFEASHWLAPEKRYYSNLLSRDIHSKLQRGAAISEMAYLAAWKTIEANRSCVNAIWERFDVVLTPGAPGHAPPI